MVFITFPDGTYEPTSSDAATPRELLVDFCANYFDNGTGDDSITHGNGDFARSQVVVQTPDGAVIDPESTEPLPAAVLLRFKMVTSKFNCSMCNKLAPCITFDRSIKCSECPGQALPADVRHSLETLADLLVPVDGCFVRRAMTAEMVRFLESYLDNLNHQLETTPVAHPPDAAVQDVLADMCSSLADETDPGRQLQMKLPDGAEHDAPHIDPLRFKDHTEHIFTPGSDASADEFSLWAQAPVTDAMVDRMIDANDTAPLEAAIGAEKVQTLKRAWEEEVEEHDVMNTADWIESTRSAARAPSARSLMQIEASADSSNVVDCTPKHPPAKRPRPASPSQVDCSGFNVHEFVRNICDISEADPVESEFLKKVKQSSEFTFTDPQLTAITQFVRMVPHKVNTALNLGMGLGKTALAIAIASLIIHDYGCAMGDIIFIVPKAIVKQFKNEVAVWAPRFGADSQSMESRVKTTAEALNLIQMHPVKWALIDESHSGLGPSTATILKEYAGRCVLFSGTMGSNGPATLVNQFQIASPTLVPPEARAATDAMVEAAMTPEPDRTPDQKQVVKFFKIAAATLGLTLDKCKKHFRNCGGTVLHTVVSGTPTQTQQAMIELVDKSSLAHLCVLKLFQNFMFHPSTIAMMDAAQQEPSTPYQRACRDLAEIAKSETDKPLVPTSIMCAIRRMDKEKVLVQLPSIPVAQWMDRELGKMMDKSNYAVVHGGTTKAEFDRAIKSFKDPQKPRFVLAGTSVISKGLHLPMGSRHISASVGDWNCADWNQSLARLWRPGQTEDVNALTFDVAASTKLAHITTQSKAKAAAMNEITCMEPVSKCAGLISNDVARANLDIGDLDHTTNVSTTKQRPTRVLEATSFTKEDVGQMAAALKRTIGATAHSKRQ